MGCPLSKTEGTPVEKNHQRPGQLSPRLAEQTRTPGRTGSLPAALAAYGWDTHLPSLIPKGWTTVVSCCQQVSLRCSQTLLGGLASARPCLILLNLEIVSIDDSSLQLLLFIKVEERV